MSPSDFGLLKALIQNQDPNRVQCPRCYGDGNELDEDDSLCQLCHGQCWVDAAAAEDYCETQAEIYQGIPKKRQDGSLR